MMMLRRQALRLALLSAFLALPVTMTGCATLAKWLPAVIGAIGKAEAVLDAIEIQANAYFEANPDPDKKKKYVALLSKAHSLIAATHASMKGADAAAKQDVDTTWAEFKKVYQEILGLLGPLGIVAPSQDGTLSASPDGPLMVPPPDAMTLE
jgi:hypothetical protein